MDKVANNIVFGTLLSLGSLVLFIIAFKVYYKYLIQEKRCTSKVKGIVKRYTLAKMAEGIHLPIVYYTVNNKEYKVVGPEYNSFKEIIKSSSTNKNNISITENNQNLIINKISNSFVNISYNYMQKMYPINSEIDVYYDPNNPKLSYVLRYCNRKWAFYLTFFASLLVLLIDLIIIFIL